MQQIFIIWWLSMKISDLRYTYLGEYSFLKKEGEGAASHLQHHVLATYCCQKCGQSRNLKKNLLGYDYNLTLFLLFVKG